MGIRIFFLKLTSFLASKASRSSRSFLFISLFQRKTQERHNEVLIRNKDQHLKAETERELGTQKNMLFIATHVGISMYHSSGNGLHMVPLAGRTKFVQWRDYLVK